MQKYRTVSIGLLMLAVILSGAACKKTTVPIDQPTVQETPAPVQPLNDEDLNMTPSTKNTPASASPTSPAQLAPVTPSTSVVSSTPTPKTQPAPVPPKPPEVKTIDVTAKTWSFEPSAITVNRGDRVRLRIKSIDVRHGFNLSAFGIKENLEPGKTVETEFVADKPGSFDFFCDVFCGEGHSRMRGTLVVNP